MIIRQNGEARAVVQDIASYTATRKALLLMKLTAQGEADIRRGRVVKHRDLMARIHKKLGPRLF